MTKDEALKLALEALESIMLERGSIYDRAITAIREALAQPEHSPNCALLKIPSKDCDCQDQQKPIAWVTGWHDGHCVIRAADPALILPIGAALYTTPPSNSLNSIKSSNTLDAQRTWVGLTDEEVRKIVDTYTTDDHGYDIWCDVIGVARAIEAKLKEKNT